MQLVILSLLFGVTLTFQNGSPSINSEFLNGYNKFVADLYKQVTQENHDNNFLISPVSADILLALAEYGSAGETSKELVKGLSLPENREIIKEVFTALTPKLNVDNLYTLSSANRIYVKQGIALLEEFKTIAVDVFNAGITNINFEAKEAAAAEMNKWVEEKTNGKIKDLIDKDQLDAYTRTFFLNALYFRGTWVTKFNPSDTKKDSFYYSEDKKTEVDLMEVTNNFRFYENHDLNAKFLELPYNGNDVTMTVVLPNNKDGLLSLEEKISEVIATNRFRKSRVHVRIPKFQIETKIEFNDYLKKLGIVRAFEDTAEFPKITGEALKINKVLQKARIEVDEEGTTAAVATAVDEVSRSAHVLRETEEFIADHPFIFILKHKDLVLFVGHYIGK